MSASLYSVAVAATSGIVGLFFYEGLRIYKKTSAGKHPVPNNRIYWHMLGLALLAVPAGCLAAFMAEDNYVEGIILGFSVPSGIKAAIGKESIADDIDDNWRMGVAQKSPRTWVLVRKLRSWVRRYFDTR